VPTKAGNVVHGTLEALLQLYGGQGAVLPQSRFHLVFYETAEAFEEAKAELCTADTHTFLHAQLFDQAGMIARHNAACGHVTKKHHPDAVMVGTLLDERLGDGFGNPHRRAFHTRRGINEQQYLPRFLYGVRFLDAPKGFSTQAYKQRQNSVQQ
jgi:hypothetical protein